MESKITKALYGYQAWDADGNYTGYWGTHEAAMLSVGEYLDTITTTKSTTKEAYRLKDKLPRGGCKAIANKVGLKPHTVWMILDGRRNNEKVVAAAEEYIRLYGERKSTNSL